MPQQLLNDADVGLVGELSDADVGLTRETPQYEPEFEAVEEKSAETDRPRFTDLTAGEPLRLAIPRRISLPEESTTYGGPRRPVASYAETMGALGELDTPTGRLIAPRPSLTEPRAELPTAMVNPKEDWKSAAIKEVYNAAKGVPEFFTSDAGILSLLAAKLSPRLASAGFAADLIPSAFQQTKQAIRNWGQMTGAQKSVAVVDTVATAIFGGLAAGHATGIKPGNLFPSSKPEMQGPLATGGVMQMPQGAKPTQVAPVNPDALETAASAAEQAGATATAEALREQAQLTAKKGAENASNVTGLIGPKLGDIVSNAPREQNIIQTGTQAEPSGGPRTGELAQDTSTSIAWLQGVSENNPTKVADATEKLLGAPMAANQRKAVLDDLNSGGSALRASGYHGTGTGEEIAPKGTRSPQEREQPGQPFGEFAVNDPLTALETSFGKSSQSQIFSEAARAAVVKAVRAMRELSDQQTQARGARSMREVLLEVLPKLPKSEQIQIESAINASLKIAIAKGISQLEVRTQLGEEAPLRQPGQAAQVRAPEQSPQGGEGGTVAPETEAVVANPPPATQGLAALERGMPATIEPRTLTDEQLSGELKSIDDRTAPLYDQLEKLGDSAFVERTSKYIPEAQAIEDQIKPWASRKELIQFEQKRRQVESQNKTTMSARDKRIAEAPVFQRRNGWEIVKDGFEYVLRDPNTKDDVYRGKLKRVREVADESKPESPNQPPAPTPAPAPTPPESVNEAPAAPPAAPAIEPPEARKAQGKPPKPATEEEKKWLRKIRAARKSWRPQGYEPIFPPLESIGITSKQFNQLKRRGFAENRGFGHNVTLAGELEINPELKESLMSFRRKPSPTGPSPVEAKAKEAPAKSEFGLGGRGGAIYSAQLSVGDFGTERILTVTDLQGRIIGKRDPFYPAGIPSSVKARQARLAQVARAIVDEYEARARPALPPAAEPKPPEPAKETPAAPPTPEALPPTATSSTPPPPLAPERQVTKQGAAGGEAVPGLSVQESTELSRLTEKIESGQKLTRGEEGRYRELLRKSTGAEGEEKPEVQAGGQPQIPEGPGALTAGTPPTGKAEIDQLTESFQNIQAKKTPLVEKIHDAFNVGRQISSAKDALSGAISGLKTSGDWLIGKWRGVNTIDDLLRAKGELSAQLETRGWRVRKWEEQAKRSVPRKRDQAAIAKWVDAGGDVALLQQGLAQTRSEYKQAYQDALDLQGDLLVAAQNIQNYFESRLQEAIDAGVLKDGVEDYIHRMYEYRPNVAKRLIANVQAALLQPNPSLARKRVFTFDWEAEQLGYRPVQSFIPRIAQYESSLSKAIASREFIRKASALKADDGRPVIDIKGVGVPIDDPVTGAREATLIKPSFNPAYNREPFLPDGSANPNYRGDYINREYPALSRWKWVAEDSGGKPIMVQGDVSIHPDYVTRIDKLLKPSAVRAFAPKGIPVGPWALGIGSTFKQTMLDLSGFHHVQITVHALEHKVNPMRLVQDIDFENADVQGLLKGGITLGGDYHYAKEGLVGASLTRQIPMLGPLMETYHSWLFQSYIPRVKMTMALNALERNRARYAGKLTDEQIFNKTALQANSAFGELNYIMLERGKTGQDIARLIMLAPDFLEARGRFAAEALTEGGKSKAPGFGNEQRAALLLGALTMYVTARLANKAIDDQWHFEPENAFSVVYGNHAYGLRTVQGDILHLLERPLQFWLTRLNPVYGRTLLELVTGRDYFGRKRSVPEILWDSVSNLQPIATRNSQERKLLESIYQSFGGNIRRYNATDDAFKLAAKWKAKHGIGEPGEFIYDAAKDPLRPLKLALVSNDDGLAAKEIKNLLGAGYNRKRLMNYFKRYQTMPFTGSRANDFKWKKELGEDDRKTVEVAADHKRAVGRLFFEALGKYDAAQRSSPATQTNENLPDFSSYGVLVE